MRAIYVITKPGSDLDGQDWTVEGDTFDAVVERKASLEKSFGWTLTLVGTKEGSVFRPSLPYEQLPWWAQQWVDERAPKVTVRSAKRRGPRRGRAA